MHARSSGRGRNTAVHCAPQEAPATDTATSQPPTGTGGSTDDPLPTILNFKEPDAQQRFQTSCKLALALPWRRFKKGSFLSIKLEGMRGCRTWSEARRGCMIHSVLCLAFADVRCVAGAIAEKKQPRFSTAISMPALCESLRKAAYDPRVAGLYLNIDLLDCGWAKVQEIRSHIEFFKASNKPTVAYMKRGGEKEYFLATACDEIYIPPVAQLSLRGLSVQGQFLRGILDKVGVEPQVRRSTRQLSSP